MNPAGYDLEGKIGYDILMTQGEDCRSKGRLISRIMKRVNKVKPQFTRREIADIEFLVNLRVLCLKQEKPNLARMSIKYYEELLEKVRKM